MYVNEERSWLSTFVLSGGAGGDRRPQLSSNLRFLHVFAFYLALSKEIKIILLSLFFWGG